MFNRQLKANIEKLDLQIGKLMDELIQETDAVKRKEITNEIESLKGIRCDLADSKVNDAIKKEIISGLISIGGMILVLKHEKTDVITTKAMSLATKLFRGV